MSIDIKVGDRTSEVRLISQNGNILEIMVDDKLYSVDLIHTPDGTFSIIENGNSYQIELVPKKESKRYRAYTRHNIFEVEIIDAESRYLKNRNKENHNLQENIIISPMPGKVVKVLKTEGDPIIKGETVIIISAMKMESEYRAPISGIIKHLYVRENDTVEMDQVLLEIE